MFQLPNKFSQAAQYLRVYQPFTSASSLAASPDRPTTADLEADYQAHKRHLIAQHLSEINGQALLLTLGAKPHQLSLEQFLATRPRLAHATTGQKHLAFLRTLITGGGHELPPHSQLDQVIQSNRELVLNALLALSRTPFSQQAARIRDIGAFQAFRDALALLPQVTGAEDPTFNNAIMTRKGKRAPRLGARQSADLDEAQNLADRVFSALPPGLMNAAPEGFPFTTRVISEHSFSVELSVNGGLCGTFGGSSEVYRAMTWHQKCLALEVLSDIRRDLQLHIVQQKNKKVKSESRLDVTARREQALSGKPSQPAGIDSRTMDDLTYADNAAILDYTQTGGVVQERLFAPRTAGFSPKRFVSCNTRALRLLEQFVAANEPMFLLLGSLLTIELLLTNHRKILEGINQHRPASQRISIPPVSISDLEEVVEDSSLLTLGRHLATGRHVALSSEALTDGTASHVSQSPRRHSFVVASPI